MGTSRILIRNVVKRAFAVKRAILIVRNNENRVVKTAVFDAAKGIAHNLNLPLLVVSEAKPATEYQGKFVLLESDISSRNNIEPFLSQAEHFLNLALAGILLFDNVHNYDQVSADLARHVINAIKGNKIAVLLSTTAVPFDCEVFEADNKSATWIAERVMPHLTRLKANPHLLKLCALKLSPNAAYKHSLKITGSEECAEALRWLAILRRDYGEMEVRRLIDL